MLSLSQMACPSSGVYLLPLPFGAPTFFGGRFGSGCFVMGRHLGDGHLGLRRIAQRPALSSLPMTLDAKAVGTHSFAPEWHPVGFQDRSVFRIFYQGFCLIHEPFSGSRIHLTGYTNRPGRVRCHFKISWLLKSKRSRPVDLIQKSGLSSTPSNSGPSIQWMNLCTRVRPSTQIVRQA